VEAGVIGVTVLGSTGSIGKSTLDVLARHPGRFRAVALTAHRDVDGLAAQCLSARPDYAVMADGAAAAALRDRLAAAGLPTRVLQGPAGLCEVCELPETRYVMAAIVGAAGLMPTLAAARAGKRVLLANKEALVMAGPLFMAAVRAGGAEVLPIDSEHNAVFQCLPPRFGDGLDGVGVRRILLTASGGPFRTTPVEALGSVTPEQACAHPNWSMGRKISVDSATMMNKGLEVIEAHWLFGAAVDRIDVVLHPQSVVHSLVEYADGSVLAQLGNPDMRTPIAHALGWPERLESGVPSLNLLEVGRLDFQAPDHGRFPCLGLAYAALRQGGAAPAVLNAANEVAVQAFFDGRLGFMGIPAVISEVMNRADIGTPADLQALLAVDAEARELAGRVVRGAR
jgi:1-deoxy-D-xylulose-5-phosphate reductoisomerase